MRTILAKCCRSLGLSRAVSVVTLSLALGTLGGPALATEDPNTEATQLTEAPTVGAIASAPRLTADPAAPSAAVAPPVAAVTPVDILAQESDDTAPFTIEANPDLRLSFAGKLELEFVDVEGKGGFSNQDTTQLRVENRSAHLQLDKAVLIAITEIYRKLFVEIELRGNENRMRIDRAFFRTRWLALPNNISIRGEFGKNTPFIRPSRRTESYPLLGTAFWKRREFHAVVEAKIELERIRAMIGFTLAQKRPLGQDDVAEDESFKLLAYDDPDFVVGNNFSYGGKAVVESYGVSAMGYMFGGTLSDNHDTKTLQDSYTAYDTLGNRNDDTHWWAGGRLGYKGYGARATGEVVYSKDGLIPRLGWYVQASYSFGHFWKGTPLSRWLRSVEPVFRFGQLLIDKLPPNPTEPESWDREMIMAGCLFDLVPGLRMKVEYYILRETTAPGGGFSVDDNQLMIQLRYVFGKDRHDWDWDD